MVKWLRHWVLNQLTVHLLKAVTEDDVLLISGKDWLFNHRKLSQEEILTIKEEALSLKESTLWKLIKRELKYGITLQRYDKAKTENDMLYGKSMADAVSKIELYIERVGRL